MARQSRTRSRHGRKARRITPRRWLPFLALIALTAGAVVLIQNEDDPTPPSRASTAASASRYLPVGAVPDALSTAWYCSGGTARGEDGPAELTVVIANEAVEGATAELTVVGGEDGPVNTEVDVPARGVIRVVVADLVTARWAGVTVEVLGGHAAVSREVSGPAGFDTSPCATGTNERWHIPSGSTVRGADAAILVYNPFRGATTVDVTFSTDDGPRTPRSLQGLSIPGQSLQVIGTEDLPARRGEIATEVVARGGQVVVDRVQIYDGSGDPIAVETQDAEPTPAPEGLASSGAIPELSPRWIFPDALLGVDTRTQLGIVNPTEQDTEIDVLITYEEPELAPAVDPVAVTVRAGAQSIVDLSEQAQLTADLPFSAEVRSLDGVPVAAELLVFGATPPAASREGSGVAEGEDPSEVPTEDEEEGDPDDSEGPAAPSAGFAVVPGSAVVASSWALPQRWANDDRTAALIVANPGSAAVEVTVDAVGSGARELVPSASVTVPAGDRRSLDLSDAAPSPMLIVTADGPVVVGQRLVQLDKAGLAASLLTPWPETVALLDPVP